VFVANAQAVRSIVSLVWRECGSALPSEEQPRFYLALEHLIREAVEQRVHEEVRRRVFDARFPELKGGKIDHS
jgi:hypothetical protein